MDTDIALGGDGRIVSNPAICHGNPVVRGTRILVWLVLEYLSNGDSVDDLIAAYPALSREDVSACLRYASKAAKERVVPVEMAAHAL